METVLIAVTAVALVLAGGMAVLTTRLLREDRLRSEARVAALAAMALEPSPDREPVVDFELRPGPTLAARENFLRSDTSPSAIVDPTSAPPLFAPHEDPSPWSRRVAIAGAITALLAAGVFVGWPGDSTAPTSSVRDAAPAAAADAAPLELVSLRHVRDAQGLTISGIVQNPRGGAPVHGLVATGYVFGPGGAFLTSGRAPLDATLLSPGEESPFIVNLPVNGDVARYRVGFRTADGAVVAHVDKREPDTLVRKQEQP